jgi:hypothetical protein
MWFTELKHSGLLLVFFNPPAAMNLTATLSNEYQKHSTSSRLSHPPSFQNSKIPKINPLKRSSCCSNNNGTTNLDLSAIYCSDHHDKYKKKFFKKIRKKEKRKEKKKPLSLR